jgi:hypothetical protein
VVGEIEGKKVKPVQGEGHTPERVTACSLYGSPTAPTGNKIATVVGLSSG